MTEFFRHHIRACVLCEKSHFVGWGKFLFSFFIAIILCLFDDIFGCGNFFIKREIFREAFFRAFKISFYNGKVALEFEWVLPS